MSCRGKLIIAIAATPSFFLVSVVPTLGQTVLEHLWTHNAGGTARAEIVAYDHVARQFLVVNGNERCVMRLDARTGSELGRFDLSTYGDPTSVATSPHMSAVAIVAPQKTDPGHVLLFESAAGPSAAGALVAAAVVRVGAVPDMLTFTPDGRYLLVANEGEPSTDYSVDPNGSASVINVSRGARRAVALNADFTMFNTAREHLVREGVRLSGPNNTTSDGRASVAQDLEPEYIAVSPDSRTAWISLQENNALAEIDIGAAQVSSIVGFGLKDHRSPANGFDASDRDGGINIQTWPVWGMYQPDAIAAFEINGVTLLATANEGDAREWGSYIEEERAASDKLQLTLFAAQPDLKKDEHLGRLRISRGDSKGNRLVSFGARSMAIWTSDGQLVYDSGDALEQFIAKKMPERFNMNEAGIETADRRSPVRGPEPEGIAIGRIGDATYAFVGLERTSAIAVFDVSRPRSSRLLDVVSLDFRAPDSVASLPARNIAPEGLAFVPAEKSPFGEPLLAVACEVSGTTVLFRVRAGR